MQFSIRRVPQLRHFDLALSAVEHIGVGDAEKTQPTKVTNSLKVGLLGIKACFIPEPCLILEGLDNILSEVV